MERLRRSYSSIGTLPIVGFGGSRRGVSPDDISPAAQDYFKALGNVDIVVYEGKRTDFFGHSYFHSNPEVSADLIELIRNGTPPGAPGRPLIRQGKVTWVFPPRRDEP